MRFYIENGGKIRRRDRRLSGMTLVEVMIAFTLMLLVLAAIVAANLIGLSENAYMSSKAGASNTSRMAVNTMLSDIRTAKGYEIGNLVGSDITSINPVTSGTIQGVAVRLFPILISTSTNLSIDYTKYIQYSYAASVLASNSITPTNDCLWRYVSTSGTETIVASNLINVAGFLSENYTGVNQLCPTYKGIVHTTLQFCEFQYPLTKVGSNYLFDYYRIDCRATPHLPDGP
jgi:type II secretory pathway pseudopilin PulG